MNAGVVIPIESERGQELLKLAQDGPFSDHLKNMKNAFVKQRHNTYCGVVSLIICSNSLDKEVRKNYAGPLAEDFQEEDFFTVEQARKAVDREIVAKEGLTLDQIFELAKALDFNPHLHRPGSSDGMMTLSSFRSLLKDCLGSKNKRIIVNYDMSVLEQEPICHFSPLGGYHEDEDVALVLDTWQTTPVGWVALERLYNAMKTIDPACGQLRGACVLNL
ncbi:uncharacterized protein [Oscarella lobularis]|uniref:uncharacterized protein n=1 Tax=Oscarella lobularis TaxID=121494 RepID=UPI00331439D1